ERALDVPLAVELDQPVADALGMVGMIAQARLGSLADCPVGAVRRVRRDAAAAAGKHRYPRIRGSDRLPERRTGGPVASELGSRGGFRLRHPLAKAGSNRGYRMRYVSTRGYAPALSFEEVMLAGLARDGGLYVPESWPRLAAEEITA